MKGMAQILDSVERILERRENMGTSRKSQQLAGKRSRNSTNTTQTQKKDPQSPSIASHLNLPTPSNPLTISSLTMTLTLFLTPQNFMTYGKTWKYPIKK